MTDHVRIAVIDDQPIFRKALVDILSSRRLTVVAEGETADDLHRIALHSKAEILIFDVGINGDGISMAEKALSARPDLNHHLDGFGQ